MARVKRDPPFMDSCRFARSSTLHILRNVVCTVHLQMRVRAAEANRGILLEEAFADWDFPMRWGGAGGGG